MYKNVPLCAWSILYAMYTYPMVFIYIYLQVANLNVPKKWLVIISGLFSCLTLIETCLACHIDHHNLVCNVYLSHGDKLYFNSNIFYSSIINLHVIIVPNKSISFLLF